jgi:hypothetical protein
MNRFILFVVLLSGTVLLFSLAGCEGPAGPQGSQGDTGPTGTPALSTGFDTLTCGKCHIAEKDTSYHVAARKFQWENSVHASGGHAYENGSSCAECHTTEGFIQKMTGQAVNVPESSPPGCFACHSPHLQLDFSLRKVTPVSLAYNINNNGTQIPASTFDYGKGNLCVQCHHPRTVTPRPDLTKTLITDTLKITNNRWYAHYGVQGQILMGEGGFEFTDYIYTGNSTHSSNSVIKTEGCTKCHMTTPEGDLAGGHTMRVKNEEDGSDYVVSCNQGGCHSSAPFTAFDDRSSVKNVKANMDTLKAQLVARGWINTSNEIQYPIAIAPASRSGALFNYMLVLHDGSEGVHNTKYASELLQSSIAELRKP